MKKVLIAFALSVILVTMVAFCSAANSRVIVSEWPLKAGDAVQISTLCDLNGFAELDIAFQTDTPIDSINDLYNLLLAKGDCLLLSDTVKATVVRVDKRITLKTGAAVYAVTLDLGDGAPLVYSFIIVSPKAEVSA